MASTRTKSALIGSALILVLGGCGGGGGGGTSTTAAGTTANTSGTGSGTTTTGSGGGTGSSGSGSTTTAAVVDKYVGSWLSTCNVQTSASTRELLTLAKTSDTTVSFTSVRTTYATLDCSGTGTVTKNETGAGTWVGTKTIGTQTVDEVTTLQTGSTTVQKQVLVIGSDGKLYMGIQAGDPGAVIDANGYPSTLQATGDTKQ